MRSALGEGPWGGSTGEAARWTRDCKASVCRQLTYCIQTSQLASLSLCFHLDESQGVVLCEQPFLGSSFLKEPCLPSRGSPQTQLSQKGGSRSQGGNQHLPVASTEVNAGQLVQLGVHPVQALVQQILGRKRTRGSVAEPATAAWTLAPLCPFPAHISRPGLRRRPAQGNHQET